MCFKYHSESAQIVYSSKETKKSYRHSCTNKTAAVHPHLSTISINLGSLSTKRSYTVGYLRRLHVSGQHFIKLQTTSQDLQKLHTSNLKSQCGSYYKSELRLGCFNTQKPSSPDILTRSLVPASWFSYLLLAYLLLDGSSWTRIHKRIPATRPTPNIWHWACNQTSGVRVVHHLFVVTLPLLKRLHPCGQKAYSRSEFTNAEQRLFGEGNYEIDIRTIQGILGNHKIMSMDTKGPKDFSSRQTKFGV
jgi:hypothetical protein